MSPTPLAVPTVYVHPGTTAVYWVVSIATIATPSRAEIDAGVDLTPPLQAVVGWRVRKRTRSIQAYGQSFAVELDGTAEVDDSWLVFAADRGGGDVPTTLPEGTDGHVVMIYGGDETGNPMDVWPVRVAALARGVDDDGTLAAVGVQFVITGVPARNLAAPAVA